MLKRGAFVFLGKFSAGGAVAGVGGRGDWDGDGVVHADEHAGLRGELDFFSFARNDVDGTAGEAEAETANNVAEDCADERAAAGADGRADDIALDVVLFLDDLAFF